MHSSTFRLFLPAAACALAMTTPLAGQDALGDGHTLDASPSTSQRQNRPVMGPWEQFDGRNRLITGNVVSGRGFRGTVGYTAADDFRDAVGSDDLFSFRADSALSGINFLNSGSTFEQLRFGQGIGLLESQRASQGVSTAASLSPQWRPQQGLLLSGLDLMSGSTSLRAAAEASVQPNIIGGFTDPEGIDYYLRASEFAGLTQTPTSQMTQIIGLSTYDHARITEDVAEGRAPSAEAIGFQFNANYLDLEVPSSRRDDPRIDRAVPREGDPEPEEAAKPAFQRIQERIAARYAQYAEMGRTETDAWLQTLDTDMEALREFLAGGAPVPDEAVEGDEPDEEGTTLPRVDLPGDGDPSGNGEADGTLPPTTLAPILRHGERIETFGAGTDNRFDEIMREGQDRLQSGEYFWAERRFARALRFTPGHPLATAGLAHAQLGAGLYHSSSVNVRRLFTQRPEMIDVRYDAALVPARDRLERAVTTLDMRLDRDRDSVASALLLAYTGRLLDDTSVVDRGLAAMRRLDPKDPLIPLLEAVWKP